jgi:hypothetical protein
MVLLAFCGGPASAQVEEEQTYDITLTKTAEVDKDIYEVDEKKVLTETFTIQKGDWIWKVLRERGLLKRRNFAELLAVLKKLNTSLENLDLVHPGDKVIIPLKIAPLSETVTGEREAPGEVTPITDLKDLDLEQYTVKPADSVIKVVTGKYDIPEEQLHREYLDLVRKLNPHIKDLDVIEPGQVIRLPIYTPQIVRKRIEAPPPPEPEHVKEDEGVRRRMTDLATALGLIFSEMGEEWIQTGTHFIPLKSGGQIDLQAASFPILNLRNGLRIIVDLNNRLPQRMTELIGSSWHNYRVVHVSGRDDLKTAFDRLVRACNYPRVFERGETLEMEGDMGFRIMGDWIIALGDATAGRRISVAVVNINLSGSSQPVCPTVLRSYLAQVGVKVIDFPLPESGGPGAGADPVEILDAGSDPSALVRRTLDLVGQDFETDVRIPLYQSKGADFKLIIKANFLMKLNGRDALITLSDLGQEVISLLEERGFQVLPLAGERDPLAVVSSTLRFIGVDCEPGPHVFVTSRETESKSVRLTLPGSVFEDMGGKPILATRLNLPSEIASFLTKRGYRVMVLSQLTL